MVCGSSRAALGFLLGDVLGREYYSPGPGTSPLRQKHGVSRYGRERLLPDLDDMGLIKKLYGRGRASVYEIAQGGLFSPPDVEK